MKVEDEKISKEATNKKKGTIKKVTRSSERGERCISGAKVYLKVTRRRGLPGLEDRHGDKDEEWARV